ncbi:MAG: hypothetical protein IJT16_08825 [Lachnospiraceae bacterium]|nr:hypothetical protein [Lachnospiraceae bacterium]
MIRGRSVLRGKLIPFFILFSVIFFTCGFETTTVTETVYVDGQPVSSTVFDGETNDVISHEEVVYFDENGQTIENTLPEPPVEIVEEVVVVETPEVSPAPLPSLAPSEVRELYGSDIYLVGDSRTVYGFMDTLDQRVNWLAACGSSYPYFNDYYVPILDRTNLKGKKIVILYGINDISYYGKGPACLTWIGFYNSKAQEWIAKGAQVYACSVIGFDYDSLPEGRNTKSEIESKNKDVEDFNALLESMLPANVGFIKLHLSTETPMRDGVHYSRGEDVVLYEGLINYLLMQ